jgi:hypothetical protein
MTDKYADMIYLPHHVSTKHPQMALIDRAAQFAPFAALTGYGAAIKESERQTAATPTLSQEQIDEINQTLFSLTDLLPAEVMITYFVPDALKSGGTYHNKTGILKRIDADNQVLIFSDKTKIPLESIISIISVTKQ